MQTEKTKMWQANTVAGQLLRMPGMTQPPGICDLVQTTPIEDRPNILISF